MTIEQLNEAQSLFKELEDIQYNTEHCIHGIDLAKSQWIKFKLPAEIIGLLSDYCLNVINEHFEERREVIMKRIEII